MDIIFQSFDRFLGVAVGEHLGYLLTGAWTILVGVAFTQTSVCSRLARHPRHCHRCGARAVLLEFVGPAERDGWKLAATLTPIP